MNIWKKGQQTSLQALCLDHCDIIFHLTPAGAPSQLAKPRPACNCPALSVCGVLISDIILLRALQNLGCLFELNLAEAFKGFDFLLFGG